MSIRDSSLSKFGVGKENNNSCSLLQFCRYDKLVKTNMEFSHRIAHKLTWYSDEDGKRCCLCHCQSETGSIFTRSPTEKRNGMFGPFD